MLLEERNAHTDEHTSPILELELMLTLQFPVVMDLKCDYSAINNDNEFSNSTRSGWTLLSHCS